VFNILLQVLEDGRLTDSFGRRVDFRNALLIMTSNVGAEIWQKQGSLGFSAQREEVTYEETKTRLMEQVKRVFKPEFLNRVDDVIVFHQLTREDLEKIIQIEFAEVTDRMKEKKMELVLTPEVINFLIERGYDPTYGARPLKRTIQRHIENVLAEEILSGKFKEGDKVKAIVRGESIVFETTS